MRLFHPDKNGDCIGAAHAKHIKLQELCSGFGNDYVAGKPKTRFTGRKGKKGKKGKKTRKQ